MHQKINENKNIFSVFVHYCKQSLSRNHIITYGKEQKQGKYEKNHESLRITLQGNTAWHDRLAERRKTKNFVFQQISFNCKHRWH